MHKPTMRTIALCTALAAVLAGCGVKDKPAAEPAAQPLAKANAAAGPNAGTPQSKSRTATVQTFYGNESGTALVARQATVSYSEDEGKYIAALNELKKAPDKDAVSLFDAFTFRKTTVDKGELRLDLSMSESGNLGASGEELMLNALQKVLFQFPEVTSIYVTKDGKQVDSLMGHMELPYPIKRK